MKAFRWIAAVLVLGANSTLFAGESNGVVVTYFETLQRLSLQTSNTVVSQEFRSSDPVALSFDALGKSFDFQLEPNAGFLSAASRSALPDGVGIYRGSLAGNPDSWVRIVTFEGVPRGLVWDGEQMYAIEAPGDSAVQTDSPVIYRLADTFIQPGTMSCGSESLSGNGALVYEKLMGELSAAVARGPGAVKQIDIGAVGDFEFTNNKGGDMAAALAIADRLNRIDGYYSQDIGVQINAPLIETFSDPADPFTDESDAALLLDEVVTYRSDTPAQNNLGLTHLYTGRVLDGPTVGIAFSNVLCQPAVGAGLSEGNGSATFDSLVAAHEIGHNFGAPHDGVVPVNGGPSCELEPQDFIMAPSVNGNDKFSLCTIAIMQANAALASCVTALEKVDMSIALNGQSSTVLLGANTVLTYDVPNNGSELATNVVADFTIPTNLTIESVVTSIGTCTEGAGAVNCVLGDVPGFNNDTVAITTTPTTVGVGMLTATITADVDERLVNNQDSLQLTVDPAVDLAVNALATVTVKLDQSATISATLENRAVLDASGVTLTVSFGTRVQVDSASWSIGTCTIAAQQVDCQAVDFVNQSNSTLTVGVTGLSAGKQSYTVTMSSNEADADLTNNNVSGTVTVKDPKDSGGAIGLPFLWFLGLAAVFVTRRRPT